MSRENNLRPPEGHFRRTVNPNGGTPVIDDDGFILWESAAVLLYLAETRPAARLLPKEIWARAIAWQWLAWEGATYQVSLVRLFLAKMTPDTPAEALQQAEKGYQQSLNILDGALSRSKWIAGESFSVADIALSPGIEFSWTRFWAKVKARGVSNAKKERSN